MDPVLEYILWKEMCDKEEDEEEEDEETKKRKRKAWKIIGALVLAGTIWFLITFLLSIVFIQVRLV